MTNMTLWTLGWAMGGAVALVAAALLIWILLAARSIEREARRVLVAVRSIEANTRPLWHLTGTRKALDRARHRLEGE
jgi:hypothetical protein